MHEKNRFDRSYDEQASRMGTLRAAILSIVREQEHRVRGLDATAVSKFIAPCEGAYPSRTKTKPRSYIGALDFPTRKGMTLREWRTFSFWVQ